MRHRDFRIRFDASDGTGIFDKDATFCARTGSTAGSVSLESYDHPGRYVRHYDYALRTARGHLPGHRRLPRRQLLHRGQSPGLTRPTHPCCAAADPTRGGAACGRPGRGEGPGDRSGRPHPAVEPLTRPPGTSHVRQVAKSPAGTDRSPKIKDFVSRG
ncbi:AbfB domain-containing protein [Streptomyces sp. AK04-3B]|uniref:AbfB domain-containing protein n=1 Tax=Streptomyces sp. AK04-3B TaxID=3028650 RepID=UPI0029C044F2|nr:AbfB domain-containing protein [Streptomyces sp. AK04-3B]